MRVEVFGEKHYAGGVLGVGEERGIYRQKEKKGQQTGNIEIPEWMRDPRALKVESYRLRSGVEEITRVVAENRKGSEEDRISWYPLVFKEDGRPDFAFENKSVLGRAEYVGMANIRNLALRGNNLVVWLSPPGGRSPYSEGRLVVGVVRQAGVRVELECRGIPLLRNRVEFDKLRQKLGESSGETIEQCEKVEDLREQPWGFKMDKAKIWQWCQEVFGMEEVWRAVETGKDVVIMNKIESEVVKVWGKMERMGVRRVGSYEESIRWGRYLADEMKQRGFEVSGWGHGGSGGEIGGNRIKSGYTVLFGRSEVAFKLEKKNGKWVCPCGEVVGEGVNVCPKCGLKLKYS